MHTYVCIYMGYVFPYPLCVYYSVYHQEIWMLSSLTSNCCLAKVLGAKVCAHVCQQVCIDKHVSHRCTMTKSPNLSD